MERKLKPIKTKNNRIYISRAGRRRIKNENELMSLLLKFHFIMIEDKPRAVAEQVEIYKNSSFIIGAHGASFTNIIYCEPGTYLFELFSPHYAPDHFLYLSKLMDLQYSAYFYDHQCNERQVKETIVEDFFVSVPELEKILTVLLGEAVVG